MRMVTKKASKRRNNNKQFEQPIITTILVFSLNKNK